MILAQVVPKILKKTIEPPPPYWLGLRILFNKVNIHQDIINLSIVNKRRGKLMIYNNNTRFFSICIIHVNFKIRKDLNLGVNFYGNQYFG